MTSSNCIFAVTLFALLHGVSSLMADTGTLVYDRKCPHGFLDTKRFPGGNSEADARQQCAQECVNYGQTCHYAVLTYGSFSSLCYLHSANCGDYRNNYDQYYDVWVRNRADTDPSRQCPGIRFPGNDNARECWQSDGNWCITLNFPTDWGRWICNNCASCVPRGGTWSPTVESAIGDIKPVETAIGDIDDKEPHKFARSMNAFQKEEVIGFLSPTRSMWMGILAIVGLLAILRSIYSVCTRKAEDPYEEV